LNIARSFAFPEALALLQLSQGYPGQGQPILAHGISERLSLLPAAISSSVKAKTGQLEVIPYNHLRQPGDL